MRLGTKTHPIVVSSPETFRLWLDEALFGEWAQYWVGHLAAERSLLVPKEGSSASAGVIGYHLVDAEPANTLARLAWEAYEGGLVELAQERAGNRLRYLVKRVKPRKGQRRWAGSPN